METLRVMESEVSHEERPGTRNAYRPRSGIPGECYV